MKFLTLPILLICLNAIAQDEYSYPTQMVGLVYVFSTSNYTEAYENAEHAAELLSTDFDNSLVYDEELGLTDTSTCGCGEKHGYIPRGRFDEGDYVSIELAESFEIDIPAGEAGKYIVVVASYPIENELYPERIENLKKLFPGAKYFEYEVYTGCMH